MNRRPPISNRADRGLHPALRALCLAPLAFLVACATAGPGSGPPTLSPQTGQPYRVGPPDNLRISILPEPEILRDVVVRPDGMISVDLIGDVPAAGRTVDEISKDIERRIGRFKRDARASVALVAALSTEITVLGEVGRPSTFPLERETRVIEALGTVGGPSLFADENGVRVIRVVEGVPQIYMVNIDAIQKGDLSTNLTLQGGDIIVVPPSGFARVGYAIQSLLFPFQQLLGLGSRVSTTVISGGAL